jgi:hypothetical protein
MAKKINEAEKDIEDLERENETIINRITESEKDIKHLKQRAAVQIQPERTVDKTQPVAEQAKDKSLTETLEQRQSEEPAIVQELIEPEKPSTAERDSSAPKDVVTREPNEKMRIERVEPTKRIDENQPETRPKVVEKEEIVEASPEKLKAIETIVNPDQKESMDRGDKGKRTAGLFGFGGSASPGKSTSSQQINLSTETKKQIVEKQQAEVRQEVITIVIIVVLVAVVFAWLAFTIFN